MVGNGKKRHSHSRVLASTCTKCLLQEGLTLQLVNLTFLLTMIPRHHGEKASANMSTLRPISLVRTWTHTGRGARLESAGSGRGVGADSGLPNALRLHQLQLRVYSCHQSRTVVEPIQRQGMERVFPKLPLGGRFCASPFTYKTSRQTF